jgi:glycine/D-amino acid oxidase-like deaminating enzyme
MSILGTAAAGAWPGLARRDGADATAAPVVRSLWDDELGASSGCDPLLGDQRAEVVVVGGGITGLVAALHLAEAGTDVALLDAHQPGWGASGRNGGSVIPGLKADPDELEEAFGPDLGPRLVRIAGGAADAVFDLVERHAIRCAPRRAGWLSAAHHPRALPRLAARAEQWQRRGVAVRMLDGSQARAITGSDAFHGGLLDPRGGAIQPAAYARGLAAAASAAGARLFGATQALSVTRDADGWTVAAPQGSIAARRVVLGTNGYTDRLWPGLRRTVAPLWSMQLATERLPQDVARRILPRGQAVSDTRRLLRYFRREPDGRFVIGARGPFRDQLHPADAAPLAAEMRALYPALAGARVTHAWSGRVAMTADHLPHLHVLAPGVFAALGYNGRGVAMATVLGRLAADLAAGAPPEALDVPVSRARGIPLAGMSRFGARAVAQAYRLLDARG